MTIEDLKRAMPGAAPVRLAVIGEALLAAMEDAEINTPLREAHFIAQVGHESCDLKYTEEIASGAAYEGRADLGNLHPGDGKRFKGRGLIQLTGRTNYAVFGRSVERDLLTDPGAVAVEPALIVGVATWFWRRKRLNELADCDDVDGITRRINGGNNGIDDRRHRLIVAKLALGVEQA